MGSTVEYRVLGRLEVLRDGEDISPRGALQRRLLCALALRGDAHADADALADVLWPGDLPSNHLAALQTHVFRLRRLLPDGSITSEPAGYRLNLAPGALDADRFEGAVYGAAERRGIDPRGALVALDAALGWWRGRPYQELGELDEARIEAERLGELHVRAQEERVECLLALSRHADVVADAEVLAAHHPLREGPQSQLMRALWSSGRAADALAVFERYRRALGEQLGMEPSTRLQQLRDEIVVSGGPSADAPSATPVAPTGGRARSAVPRYASSFVGREALVAEVAGLLERERLVTLLGTGGVGKTRVAAEVCAALADGIGSPVWFCELAAADPASVVLTVAAVLGVEERSDSHLVARVAEVLRSQGGLLVLDNCEHVVDSVAALAEAVLAAAPECQILATSRERLAVDGEHLYPVAPLPRPDGGDAEQPAVRLFLDRARAVRPEWEPAVAERATVAELCRRLDGLPLAIELAAARMHTATLAELADGIERRFRVLTGGRRAIARHRSLAAAISWSYDLLDEPERTMFDAVSVFQSPFTRAGAAAVHGCAEEEAGELLHALVERSLLQRAGERHAMLETLRQFGADRLADAGLAGTVRARHARYHVAFADDASRRLRLPGAVGVLDDLDASLSDLRVAKRFLAEEGDHDALLHLVLSLRDLGFYRMRPEVLGWARDAAVLAHGEESRDERVAEAFAVASLEAWKRGDIDRSRAEGVHAAAVMDAAGRRTYHAIAERGHSALIAGSADEAIARFDAALATREGREDILKRVEAHGSRVITRAYSGDPALESDVDALLGELAGGLPELPAAWAWYAVGEAVLEIDPALAAERLRRSMELAERCGASFITGVAGASFVSLEARHGNPLVAAREYRWLLPHWQRAGVRSLQWTTLRAVAELLVRLHCDRAAAVLLGAVTSTRSGHQVFGGDARRLAAVDRAVRDRLGDGVADQAMAEGGELDDDEAVAVALAALDEAC